MTLLDAVMIIIVLCGCQVILWLLAARVDKVEEEIAKLRSEIKPAGKGD